MARFTQDGPGGDFEDQQQARQDRMAERQAAAEAAAQPAVDPAAPPVDPAAEEQGTGRDRLQDQVDETAGVPTPGAPAKPRPGPKSNTPLGIGGTFAQVGSQAASAFRSPEFFTNRVIGGGQPLRFGAGSGSSLGGVFGGPGQSNMAPGKKPGLNEDDLLMAIQAAGGGMSPWGG